MRFDGGWGMGDGGGVWGGGGCAAMMVGLVY